MMDFTKIKKLTIGGVELKQLLVGGIQVWKSGYKNWVKYSTEADGVTIYNGGLGYKYGYRVRSGGAEAEMANGVCTGFIPVKAGDVVRLTGWYFIGVSAANAINVADSNFTNIGQITSQAANSGIFAGAYSAYGWSSVVKESEGVWKWVVPPSASGVAYIRVSGYEHAKVESSWDADMIVTINEDIE